MKPVSVNRGTMRPVQWRLWSDIDLTVPRLLPDGGFVTLQVSRNGTSLSLRSDEDDGLIVDLGNEATTTPASVTWTPTVTQSRLFSGRARVELEYWHLGEQIPLLPPRSFVDFIRGDNTDVHDVFFGQFDGSSRRQSGLNLLLLHF